MRKHSLYANGSRSHINKMTEVNISTDSKNNTIDTDVRTSKYVVASISCASIVAFICSCVLLALYGRNPTYLSWLIAFEAAILVVATRWSLIRHIALVHCLSNGRELLGWTDVVMPYISLLGSWIPISIYSFVISQRSPILAICIYTIFALIYACGIIRFYRFPSQPIPVISVVAICVGIFGCPFMFLVTILNSVLPDAINQPLVLMVEPLTAMYYCIWLCLNFHNRNAISWQRFVESRETNVEFGQANP